MKSAELIVFDLDGTLIDSKLDLVNSVNATRAWAGHAPLPVELVSSYVGNGAPMLVKRALPDATEAQLAEALQYFLEYYREHMLDETTLYPGVREALDTLHGAGKPLAILTNKPVRFSVTLIERLGLDGHFFRIFGGNSFEEKKPHPVGLRALLDERGVVPERAVMVGDSAVDILTARNAGTMACGVSWGFQPETLVTAPPDLLIDDLRELSRLICE
jgi:phosphoglycolate phosphatase